MVAGSLNLIFVPSKITRWMHSQKAITYNLRLYSFFHQRTGKFDALGTFCELLKALQNALWMFHILAYLVMICENGSREKTC